MIPQRRYTKIGRRARRGGLYGVVIRSLQSRRRTKYFVRSLQSRCRTKYFVGAQFIVGAYGRVEAKLLVKTMMLYSCYHHII